MAEAPDDVPVRVAQLHRGHVALLVTVAVGLVLLTCAAGVLAALVMSGLISVGWAEGPGDVGCGVALARLAVGV